MRVERVVEKGAASHGLWTMPLSPCYLGEPVRQGLVLGFGGTRASGMRDAVRALRKVIASV